MIDLTALTPERVRPLLRSEYDRLIELGCFHDEKIELLAGILVEMSPQGAPHSYAVQQLNALLVTALAGRAIVRPQCSFALSEDSEPEPDLAVVPRESYAREHPGRAFLMIEVAESSLRKDRKIKASLYARAGVPEYWIVDVVAGVIEVHRSPSPEAGRYLSITPHQRHETVHPQAFVDIVIPVAEIVPPAPDAP